MSAVTAVPLPPESLAAASLPQIDYADAYLAFARGRRFCLGAALARLEGELGLGVLFARLQGLRLDPLRPSAPRGHELRAPPALHVRWGK